MEEGRFLAFTCLKKNTCTYPQNQIKLSNQTQIYSWMLWLLSIAFLWLFLIMPLIREKWPFIGCNHASEHSKEFYVWEHWLWFCALFLFACLFYIEKCFDLSFPISEICRIAVCKSIPATRRKKSCVNEHDSDILQWVSQVIKLSVRKWNFLGTSE